MDKERKMRYSDAELGLIKSVFAENDSLLYTVRKFFQGFELTKEENDAIKALSSESIAVIRKTLIPQIEATAPMFQMTDLLIGVNTKDNSIEKSYQDMLVRGIVEDYLTTQFEILDGKKVKNIDVFSLQKMKGKDVEQAVIDLSARNMIIGHIDMQLYQLKVLAGQKSETVEQTQERLAKNSNK